MSDNGQVTLGDANLMMLCACFGGCGKVGTLEPPKRRKIKGWTNVKQFLPDGWEITTAMAQLDGSDGLKTAVLTTVCGTCAGRIALELEPKEGVIH